MPLFLPPPLPPLPPHMLPPRAQNFSVFAIFSSYSLSSLCLVTDTYCLWLTRRLDRHYQMAQQEYRQSCVHNPTLQRLVHTVQMPECGAISKDITIEVGQQSRPLVYLPVQSVNLFVCMCACVSSCLLVCPSVWLPVWLSVAISVWLSTKPLS